MAKAREDAKAAEEAAKAAEEAAKAAEEAAKAAEEAAKAAEKAEEAMGSGMGDGGRGSGGGGGGVGGVGVDVLATYAMLDEATRDAATRKARLASELLEWSELKNKGPGLPPHAEEGAGAATSARSRQEAALRARFDAKSSAQREANDRARPPRTKCGRLSRQTAAPGRRCRWCGMTAAGGGRQGEGAGGGDAGWRRARWQQWRQRL